MSNNLEKVDPDKITESKENFFLTLGLIRNDFGDLLRLQALHAESDEVAKAVEKTAENPVNAEMGRVHGRHTLLLRLVLSHLYSGLEFLKEKNEKMKENDLFTSSLRRIERKNRRTWYDFVEIANATVGHSNTIKNLDIDSDWKKVLKASNLLRNRFTYHYKNSTKYLNIGMGHAFSEEMQKRPEREYAVYSDLQTPENPGKIDKFRSFYVDAAFQDYVKHKLNLEPDPDIYWQLKDPMIKILSKFSFIVSLLLKSYHTEIKS